MLRLLSLLFIFFLCTPKEFGIVTCVRAQNAQTYTTESGQTHLAGPHSLADLQNTPFAKWYAEKAATTVLPETTPEWAAKLKETKVKIFLGTWCGDSKTWVPQFVTLWKALGLSEDQLEFVALYREDERYKQGPNREEVGYDIHRVPTFIFQEEGTEYARIVERPQTDLLTDVAHIALGYPSAPRYGAATYLLQLFAEQPVDSIRANLRTHLRSVRRQLSSTSELNTLGYVLFRADRQEEAMLAFEINALAFPYNPRALGNYAQGTLELGDEKKALELYERILGLTPDDQEIIQVVEELRAGVTDNEKK